MRKNQKHRRKARMQAAVKRAVMAYGTYNSRGYLRRVDPREFTPGGMSADLALKGA